jgi:DNA-binding MarR family transcriptional regulator
MSRRPPPADFYRAEGYLVDESVGYLMKQVMASMRQAIDGEMCPHGMTHVQWGPLFKMREGRECTVAELARELDTDPGAMTRLLDRLEAKGLCKRVRSTEDRRVVNVALTPAGEKAASKVPQALSKVSNAHLAGFSRTEWQTLQGYLRRMLDNGEASRSDAAAPTNPNK